MTPINPRGRIPFPYQQAPTTIFCAGLLAGVLDGLAAVVSHLALGGREPLKIFSYIGSGVFGIEAFNGSIPIMISGFVFHFIIAWCFAIFYFFIYSKIDILRNNWIGSGLGYGVFVWLVMNLLVLPISKVPPLQYSLMPVIRSIIILMIFIGLPISYMVNRYYAYTRKQLHDRRGSK